MNFLIGGRGRLGQAIARQYAADDIVSLEREVYQHWAGPGAQADVAAYFAPWAGTGATIFVTSGLLDPKLPAGALWQVNVELPRNIIEGAAALGLRVITFGTVMEALLAARNPYVNSKAALGEFAAARAAEGAPVTHVRVHTLYGGGLPSRFMFLGQILDALDNGAPFRMTQGKQLREYHHVDDDACAIRMLAETGVNGVLDLSHGAPLSLRELAGAVFETFGAAGQLQVGTLPEPGEENYNTVFARHPMLERASFRDTLPALVAYLEECGIKRKTGQ
ncbi:NAD(P)-dependent oxidoreductase [Massilia sp.]|uniref:NAD-dependent epimerase/dehydratase family protein n=2 Tax=Burkholderiales TaxID=80840 RepID=UPI0028AE1C0D|nr:NAD(P)-dependent oxidoreductase [Massilia sp.]